MLAATTKIAYINYPSNLDPGSISFSLHFPNRASIAIIHQPGLIGEMCFFFG